MGLQTESLAKERPRCETGHVNLSGQVREPQWGGGKKKDPGSLVLNETKSHGSKQMDHIGEGNDKDKINLWSYC